MAANPLERPVAFFPLRLEPFAEAHADVVASWVRTPREAYLLAPRTAPPIDAAKVRGWCGAGQGQLVLCESGRTDIVAYGELNELHANRGEFWLGHLIVDPRRRGEGLGYELTRQLLMRAFFRFRARRVSLVVFAENHPAVECYKRAGMYPDGYELHELPAYGGPARLLRMAATASG